MGLGSTLHVEERRAKREYSRVETPGRAWRPLGKAKTELMGRLLCEGKSNKEIAAEMNITVNSAKVYVSNYFKQIGVKSRLQAALWWAKQHGTQLGNSDSEFVRAGAFE